jgi:hypothetical protein
MNLSFISVKIVVRPTQHFDFKRIKIWNLVANIICVAGAPKVRNHKMFFILAKMILFKPASRYAKENGTDPCEFCIEQVGSHFVQFS